MDQSHLPPTSSVPQDESLAHIPTEVRYSVIVPTFNAASTLRDCLDALFTQSVQREMYEVVVVDDGSIDGTEQIARGYPVRFFKQQHAGPASARNRGAREAVGDFLLFTDADCIPAQSWIADLVRPLETDPSVAAAKGVYRTRQRSLIARFAQVEFEEKFAALRRHHFIDFIDTYSAVFRRGPFWECGAFDPSFRSASNEDTQLSFNLAARGYHLVFAENAIVYHRHSDSLLAYLRRKWRHGYWRIRVYQRHPGKLRGDSYTPRSMQIQFLTLCLAVVAASLPGTRRLSWLFLVGFAAATLPMTRQARRQGLAVMLAAPGLVFLRAMALSLGLAAGLAQLALNRSLASFGTCRRASQ